MEKFQNTPESAAPTNSFTRLFKWLKNKIADLFEPEEVEVTFTTDGKHVSYTYTKVHHHKQVA